MAEIDNSLALQVKPPQTGGFGANPIETLIGLENFRKLQQENQMLGLQTKQKGVDVQSLQNYGQSGNLNDLRGASPELRNTAAEADTKDFQLGAVERGRAAYDILSEKDPKEKMKKWQEQGDKWADKGWVHKDWWQRNRNNPSDIVLNGVIRNSMDTAQHMSATGQTAGADAAARAPYEVRTTQPGETVQYPGARPGAPVGQVGQIVPGGNPMTGTRAPQANSTKADITQYNKDDPYYQEAPVIHMGGTLPSGPGVVQSGVHPVAAEAAKQGLTKMENYSQNASAAAKDQAELGSLRSELESGRVKTGTFTEVKMTVAGAIYGLTRDPELARSLTGINLPWNEVFSKDATRRGLTFARQTEGAREAVQAIQIALRANPGLLNTPEGNKKILDILESGDKYDQEMSRGAQSYYMKQQDVTGTGHLEGFENHWTKAHHPATFVSKAVPYQLPPDPGNLKDGVTYEFPVSKDSKGKPIMGTGTYNMKTHHFDPVKE